MSDEKDPNELALKHIMSMQEGTQSPVKKQTMTQVTTQLELRISQEMVCKRTLNFPGRSKVFAYKDESVLVVAIAADKQTDLINVDREVATYPIKIISQYFRV